MEAAWSPVFFVVLLIKVMENVLAVTPALD